MNDPIKLLQKMAIVLVVGVLYIIGLRMWSNPPESDFKTLPKDVREQVQQPEIVQTVIPKYVECRISTSVRSDPFDTSLPLAYFVFDKKRNKKGELYYQYSYYSDPIQASLHSASEFWMRNTRIVPCSKELVDLYSIRNTLNRLD